MRWSQYPLAAEPPLPRRDLAVEVGLDGLVVGNRASAHACNLWVTWPRVLSPEPGAVADQRTGLAVEDVSRTCPARPSASADANSGRHDWSLWMVRSVVGRASDT